MTHTSLKENQGTVQIKNQNVDVIDLPGNIFFFISISTCTIQGCTA